MDIFYPEPLEKGDKIAIISPASPVNPEYVYSAMERIMERGYEPVLMPYALDHVDGNFAASKGDRLIDFIDAIENQEYKAVLCSRGGYGCCQLLDNISSRLISRNPKWLIGFSDISALHALFYSSGVASIHGPMAKHLATLPADDPCTAALFRILENGGRFEYSFPAHPLNMNGTASGVLRGGNMAVLNDLSDTPYDILKVIPNEDVILFFEDIAEPIYKVNRMLHRLLLSGSLSSVKGIIFGQFTEYRPDKNFDTMESMIRFFAEQSIVPNTIPIVFNFPVGHSDFNFPLTEGSLVELVSNPAGVTVRTIF